MTINIADLPAVMQLKTAPQPCPVDKLDGPCWIWSGAINHKGYGHIYIDGVTRRAHRVAYERLVGPIASGLHLDHLCLTKRCINPDHLEPVTNQVNQQRTERATKTHCIRGHLLAGHNLIVKSPKSGGQRQCRECKRLSRSGRLTVVQSVERSA